MLISLLHWWYLGGWRGFILSLKEKLRNSADFFSIGILFKTLFAPFRQISAGVVGNSLESKLHALLDRLVSRIMGAIVRIFIILAGIFVLVFQLIFGVTMAILWPVIPFLPVVCIILMLAGVTFS